MSEVREPRMVRAFTFTWSPIRSLLTTESLVHATKVLVSGVLFSIVLYTIWTSRLLRPIADDYGIAVAAHKGLFEGIGIYWRTWSGAITTTFSFLLFAGIPLARLPWPLASSVPFIASAGLMASLGTWLIKVSLGKCEELRVRRQLVVVSVALLATWWGYWWLPVPSPPTESDSYAIALAMTHWQSLSAGYILPAGFLIWVWLLVQRRQNTSNWWHYVAATIIGLLAGLNGPVFASTSLALVLLLVVIRLLKEGFLLTVSTRKLLVSSSGVIAGALISHFSPGSRYRATLLANPNVDSSLISRLITEALPAGLTDWFRAMTSQSAVIVIVVMVGITYLFMPVSQPGQARTLMLNGLGLSGFSLIFSLANRASELFAYEAFWHVIGPMAVAWLGLVATAMGIGLFLSRLTRPSIVRLVIVSTTAVGLYLLVGSLDLMCRQIIDRSEPWELGPAPVYDISDIEDPVGWILPTWLELQELRDAPQRMLP